jgi:hypothetical protein
MLGFASVSGTAVGGRAEWLTAASVSAAVSPTAVNERLATKLFNYSMSIAAQRLRDFSYSFDHALTTAMVASRVVFQNLFYDVSVATIDPVRNVLLRATAFVDHAADFIRNRVVNAEAGLAVSAIADYVGDRFRRITAGLSVASVVERSTTKFFEAMVNVTMPAFVRVWQIPKSAYLSVASIFTPNSIFRATFISAQVTVSAQVDWIYSLLIRSAIVANVTVTAVTSKVRDFWIDVIVPVFSAAVVGRTRNLLNTHVATLTQLATRQRTVEKVAESGYTVAASMNRFANEVKTVVVGVQGVMVRVIPMTKQFMTTLAAEIDADRQYVAQYIASVTASAARFNVVSRVRSAGASVAATADAMRSLVFSAVVSTGVAMRRSINRVVETSVTVTTNFLRLINTSFTSGLTATMDYYKQRGEPALDTSNHEMFVPLEVREMTVEEENREMNVPAEDRTMTL